MSELIVKPVNPLFNCACQMMAHIVWPQGYDVSENAPRTLKALKDEYRSRGRITVYSGGSDKTIFDDAGVNQDFRAWHDWCHLRLDADFSPRGEAMACDLQAAHIRVRYGAGETGRELVKLLEAEVIGQSLYYQKYKEYVDDQRAFAIAYMQNADEALSRRW
jgi:hypothetical protein